MYLMGVVKKVTLMGGAEKLIKSVIVVSAIKMIDQNEDGSACICFTDQTDINTKDSFEEVIRTLQDCK
jgi:hypothetical protein